MATQFSMLNLMNAALTTQGCDELLAENDGTVEGRLLSLNWPTIVEAELENGLYNFTKRQVELVTRQPGAFGYDDAYFVPEASLHVRRLWIEHETGDRDFPDWVQDGNKVHLNHGAGCFIEYVEAADPSFWSANFSRGVQLKLEAVLARFKEESGSALDQQAEAYFQQARTNSSKARSAKSPFKQSSYARARFRRG